MAVGRKVKLLVHLWRKKSVRFGWACKLVQPQQEPVEPPQQVKNRTTYDSSRLSSACIPEGSGTSTINLKRHTQPKSGELSFTWGVMQARAQEAACTELRGTLRRGGGGPCVCDLGEGGGPGSQAHTVQKVPAGHEEQTSPWRTLVLF